MENTTDNSIHEIKLKDINLEAIKKNLPYKKNDEDSKKREKMFKSFDPNGNGYISLAEIDKGFNDMGEAMRPIYLSKKALIRAF